ncbi:pyridoxal-dependent decarboxylase, exosortase A system-associated [Sphingomonas immobilis]|uniref:Pyridoxal-dependent decarboxylase, exosortase A system-associated n=1 Tax=Sphingomonas immobilis TaxID=3063997 RepID=A0ABT9A6A7_9SPHN|nr:pyridoxal-dependent decarboxylase, exosortase A system-associated [Sphingomonas sp. CA1-15]MDO7844297.1 pyridoxal-dependent decarboxylase, exosortase A system-associated [Sphingomonas sp. CA1-15]
MKAMGTIPAEFAGARLRIAGRSAEEWVAKAGDTPLFVYDLGVVESRIARFRAAFPNVDLHYAIKANPFAPLVAAIEPLVDGLDVASSGELEIAWQTDPAAKVSFAGPGKRDDELEFAIRLNATINLESANEAVRALRIGKQLKNRPRLAVRVNPEIELRGSGMRMGGRASPFGIDADRAAAVARTVIDAGADWRGWHIFAGSQALDAGAIIETQAATLDLAERLTEDVGVMPPLVNLGGGFGIPYFPGEVQVDVESVGAALAGRLTSSPLTSRFAIELGRWLVGEAGVYLTRVVDRKVSRGETFIVTDGGMNHQLAASGNLGTVVRRNYPVAVATADADADAPTETVSVVGPLCTPLDRLADQVALPEAHPGDIIAVFMAGAYGLSASPAGFLGHVKPAEILGAAERS